MEQDKQSQEGKQSVFGGDGVEGTKFGPPGRLPWSSKNPRIRGILTTPEAPCQICSPEVLATPSPGGS